MSIDTSTTTTAVAGSPSLDAVPLTEAGAFVQVAGLVVEEVTGTRLVGHVDVGPDHHTPWGIVHGGVYTTAVESAASIGSFRRIRSAGRSGGSGAGPACGRWW